MARSIFGGEFTHVAASEDTTNIGTTAGGSKPALVLDKSVAVQFLTAPGGTVVTDYMLKDGTGNFTVPATSVTTTSAGLLPEFQGPDGTTALYTSLGAVLLARPVATAAGYTKPTGGIPETDLDAATQTKLNSPSITLDGLTHVSTASSVTGDMLVKQADGTFRVTTPPPLPYAPEGYTPTNFVPIIFVNEGAAVPAGTAAGTLIGYLAGAGTVWGYGTTVGGGGNTATPATRTLAAGIAAGTLIVLGAVADAALGVQATWSATDSKGNTYAVAATHIQASTSQTAILYGRVATALVAGDTITVSTTETRAQLAFTAATVTGAALTAQLDKTATNGSSPIVTSLSVGPSATTVQSDEIAFAAFGFNSSGDKVFSATNGWVLGGPIIASSAGTGQRGVAMVYKVLTTASAPTASGTLSVAESFSAVLATFKKAV